MLFGVTTALWFAVETAFEASRAVPATGVGVLRSWLFGYRLSFLNMNWQLFVQACRRNLFNAVEKVSMLLRK
jgi:hypothetical protein